MDYDVKIKIQVNDDFAIEAANPHILKDVLLNLQCFAISAEDDYLKCNGRMPYMLRIARQYERDLRQSWLTISESLGE